MSSRALAKVHPFHRWYVGVSASIDRVDGMVFAIGLLLVFSVEHVVCKNVEQCMGLKRSAIAIGAGVVLYVVAVTTIFIR